MTYPTSLTDVSLYADAIAEQLLRFTRTTRHIKKSRISGVTWLKIPGFLCPSSTQVLSLVASFNPSPPLFCISTAVRLSSLAPRKEPPTMFTNRKFSMNRNTGVPRPARRFSIGEPSLNGETSARQDRSAKLTRTTTPTEASSKIHRQFRAAHEGHLPHAGLDASRASTGVVWCTERASEYGFYEEGDKWANLGQGAPEVRDSAMLLGLADVQLLERELTGESKITGRGRYRGLLRAT